ncbi:hypothetical protein AB0E88_07360 [Streptomyces sp. NPDC028635]
MAIFTALMPAKHHKHGKDTSSDDSTRHGHRHSRSSRNGHTSRHGHSRNK